jgi:outer membrane protein N
MRAGQRTIAAFLCLGITCFLTGTAAWAQEVDDQEQVAGEGSREESREEAAEEFEALDEQVDSTARGEEAALNEDPEAQRRAKIEQAPEMRSLWPNFELYGSVRLHAIKNFNEKDEQSEFSLGDGASRIGIRGEWQFVQRWWLLGRAEGGFDVLDTFTPKAGDEEKDNTAMTKRLLYAGLDSDNLTVTYGKSWSAYYKIAGMADRFSIFGGSGVGVYNAGTDGGGTGTGRADDVLQARIYTSSLKVLRIKPFNLNVQYQYGQPIPQVQGRNYARAFGASAWLESQGDRGLGLAFQRSEILDLEDSLIRQAGIDDDAETVAMAFRTFGKRWYAALVVARMDNIKTTDQGKYVNGSGAELYAQWEFKERWWFIGGGNWFKPDDDDPEAGQYEVAYWVVGLRYTLDSFNRMLYAEYRIDSGTLFDGTDRKNEFTLGFRWDFGY